MRLQRITDPDRLQALVGAMLLIEADSDLDAILRHLVRVACDLVGAQYGALGVLDNSGTRITDFVTHGIDDETHARIGHPPVGRGLLGDVIHANNAIRVADINSEGGGVMPAGHPSMHNFLGSPVRTSDGRTFGNLYLTNKFDGEFTDEDESLIEVLGRAAGLVIDKARTRETISTLTLAAERERIARDLHDSVIQRLFAVGLTLQATLLGDVSAAARDKINEAVDSLDHTIREIRTTIFEISRNEDDDESSFRGQVLRLIDEVPTAAGLHIDLSFDGPLDSVIGAQCRDNALNSLREILANIVRHAQATRAIVRIDVTDGELTISAEDNGRGLGERHGDGRGLGNLSERAAAFGGTFHIANGPHLGTIATWHVTEVTR